MKNKEVIKEIKKIFNPYNETDIDKIYNKAKTTARNILFQYHEEEREDFTDKEAKTVCECLDVIRLIELKRELETK